MISLCFPLKPPKMFPRRASRAAKYGTLLGIKTRRPSKCNFSGQEYGTLFGTNTIWGGGLLRRRIPQSEGWTKSRFSVTWPHPLVPLSTRCSFAGFAASSVIACFGSHRRGWSRERQNLIRGGFHFWGGCTHRSARVEFRDEARARRMPGFGLHREVRAGDTKWSGASPPEGED